MAPLFTPENDFPIIAVIGDVMLDRYLVGAVDRISPEAPVPVLRVSSAHESPGGAANVAANVRSLGGSPALVGVIGVDPEAALLRNLLARDGVKDDHLVSVSGRRTTIKTRLISQQHQIARFDVEDVTPSTAHMTLAIGQSIARARIVVVSDYAKGVCASQTCLAVMQAARAAGVPVIVDPKDRDFTKYRGASIITPNRSEAAAASGRLIRTPEDAIAAARELRLAFDFEWVIVTLGEQGMIAVSPDQQLALPTTARNVFDVTGAGDTVVACLATCLARGMLVPDACRYANFAAGLQVGRVGTVPIAWSEVEGAADADAGAAVSKFKSTNELARIVRSAQAAGKKVGFTNGCFDILHHGHVALLAAAARECDVLVVAVNSDASVTRIKGAPRPFVPAMYRKAVLAGLQAVDYVTEFEEDTPLSLIAALRPDVLIKGADYTTAQVVGADLVEQWGGRVATPLLVPDVSTTNIVERILATRSSQRGGA